MPFANIDDIIRPEVIEKFRNAGKTVSPNSAAEP